MKQTIFALALGSSLLLTSVAYANSNEIEVRLRAATDTPSKFRLEMKENKEDRRASTTERREEKKEKQDDRRASSTEKRIEMQQGIASRRAEQAGRVLAATIDRLEKIVLRVDSRIAKVKAEGGVTAESEAFSAQAKVHLSEARQSLATFSSIDLRADKAQENFAKVRDAANATKEHIRAAHESLMQAIRALKPGRSNHEATTTASTTPQ